MKKIIIYNFLLFCLSLASCKKETITMQAKCILKDSLETPHRYIFASHTYINDNENPAAVNCGILSIDFTPFDMVLLGGDMMYSSSKYQENLENLDQLFNLSNPNTLWAVGNHDYYNIPLLQTYTNRPTYYKYHKDGITFLVLDTQIDSGYIIGPQLDLIQQIADTISESSHLIVLHHKLLWMYGDPYLEPMIANVANGPLGTCNYCTPPNNFNEDVMPILRNINDKGIGVICLAGDIGLKVQQFKCKLKDDFYLLASGLSYGRDCDLNYALEFRHYPQSRRLQWCNKTLTEFK